MIEREITRDISKYETKLVGPFTTRQIVCGIPGLALGVGVYFALRHTFGDTAMLFSVVAAAPFMLCGFWKPFKMPLEKFAKEIIKTTILAPSKRKYVSENTYNQLLVPSSASPVSKSKYVSKNPECEEI